MNLETGEKYKIYDCTNEKYNTEHIPKHCLHMMDGIFKYKGNLSNSDKIFSQNSIKLLILNQFGYYYHIIDEPILSILQLKDSRIACCTAENKLYIFN